MTTLDEILDTFSFFDNWEDKYRYLMELGKGLEDFPDHLKSDERLVKGCQSQVWLDYQYDPATNQIQLRMDSDAYIVRGLIRIVLAALNRRTPQAIIETDLLALFTQLDLMAHLSLGRGNGLRAMITRIQSLASNQLAEQQ